jgi:bacterioferritin-associated ferredoxin
MDNNLQNQQRKLICYCSGTSEAKIKELLANNVNTIENIVNATGATTGCGACENSVVDLLAQHNSTG